MLNEIVRNDPSILFSVTLVSSIILIVVLAVIANLTRCKLKAWWNRWVCSPKIYDTPEEIIRLQVPVSFVRRKETGEVEPFKQGFVYNPDFYDFSIYMSDGKPIFPGDIKLMEPSLINPTGYEGFGYAVGCDAPYATAGYNSVGGIKVDYAERKITSTDENGEFIRNDHGAEKLSDGAEAMACCTCIGLNAGLNLTTQRNVIFLGDWLGDAPILKDYEFAMRFANVGVEGRTIMAHEEWEAVHRVIMRALGNLRP